MSKEFYEECKKYSITKLDTEAKKQKAILIGKKYNISENEIFEIIQKYNQIEEKQKAESKRQKEESAKKELYDRHAKEQQKVAVPYNLFGAEKWIQPFLDEIDIKTKELDELYAKARSLGANLERYNNPRLHKKQDWAITGGIASGIAGPAAGIAAAIDAQNKNASIERTNREIIEASSMLSFYTQNQLNGIKSTIHYTIKEIEALNEKIDKIELKLVEEKGFDEILQLLNITDVKITDRKVSIEATPDTEKLFIYGDTVAVIDGTFLLHIYQDYDYIGSVRIILPHKGISKKKRFVTETHLGIDLDKDCSYEIEVEKLWLIEK